MGMVTSLRFQRRGLSWPAERLSASSEGPFSTDLVRVESWRLLFGFSSSYLSLETVSRGFLRAVEVVTAMAAYNTARPLYYSR